MGDVETIGGSAAGGGVIGTILAWFGFRDKIKTIETNVKGISDKMDKLVTKVALDERCLLIHKNLDDKINDLKKEQKETNNNLKFLTAQIMTLAKVKKDITE